MYNKFQINSFLLKSFTILLLFLTISCDDNDEEEVNEEELVEMAIPTVNTINVTEIEFTSAITGGEITDDGNSFVITKGVCWSTSPMPTLEDNFTEDGSGNESFVSELTSLEENTTYYVRAYATNVEGTAYGNEVNFTSMRANTVFEGNVILKTQDDVDEFGQNGYTTINGNLDIGALDAPNEPSIENLQSLNRLTSIEGYLRISTNIQLESLEGLNSLESIGTTLTLQGNPILESVEALDNLQVIGNNLNILDCYKLKNIDAFSNIETINRLAIVNAESLTDINGLSGLKEVRNDIFLQSNDSLRNIDGFINLVSVFNRIQFDRQILDNIDGLQSLTNVEASIIFVFGSTASIDGLRNLRTVGGLILRGSFENVDALSNLQSTDFLFLESPNLVNIDALNGMEIGPIGTLSIIGSQLTNLDALNGIVPNEILELKKNSKLTNVSGLSNCQSLFRLILEENDAIANLNGLENIKEIRTLVRISENELLSDFCALKLAMENSSFNSSGYEVRDNRNKIS